MSLTNCSSSSSSERGRRVESISRKTLTTTLTIESQTILPSERILFPRKDCIADSTQPRTEENRRTEKEREKKSASDIFFCHHHTLPPLFLYQQILFCGIFSLLLSPAVCLSVAALADCIEQLIASKSALLAFCLTDRHRSIVTHCRSIGTDSCC